LVAKLNASVNLGSSSRASCTTSSANTRNIVPAENAVQSFYHNKGSRGKKAARQKKVTIDFNRTQKY